MRMEDGKKNIGGDRRNRSPLPGTRILDTVKRLSHVSHISPSEQTASPAKMNLNLDKIDAKHMVNLGRLSNTNSKDQ